MKKLLIAAVGILGLAGVACCDLPCCVQTFLAAK